MPKHRFVINMYVWLKTQNTLIQQKNKSDQSLSQLIISPTKKKKNLLCWASKDVGPNRVNENF